MLRTIKTKYVFRNRSEHKEKGYRNVYSTVLLRSRAVHKPVLSRFSNTACYLFSNRTRVTCVYYKNTYYLRILYDTDYVSNRRINFRVLHLHIRNV